jgi:uncharacterized membrane protein (UPF0127 family)
MKKVLISNVTHPEVQPVIVNYCDSFFTRLRGLILAPPVRYNEGLLLVYWQENRLDTAIHMLGVRTDLVVVWINKEYIVVEVILALKTRLAYIPHKPACFVLELNPQRIKDFIPGDRIHMDKYLDNKNEIS